MPQVPVGQGHLLPSLTHAQFDLLPVLSGCRRCSRAPVLDHSQARACASPSGHAPPGVHTVSIQAALPCRSLKHARRTVLVPQARARPKAQCHPTSDSASPLVSSALANCHPPHLAPSSSIKLLLLEVEGHLMPCLRITASTPAPRRRAPAWIADSPAWVSGPASRGCRGPHRVEGATHNTEAVASCCISHASLSPSGGRGSAQAPSARRTCPRRAAWATTR